MFSTFGEIIAILGQINHLNETSFLLDLNMSYYFTVLFFNEQSFIPTVFGDLFLIIYLEQIKFVLLFLLEHPERVQYIVQTYGIENQMAFTEIVGNLTAMSFIHPEYF